MKLVILDALTLGDVNFKLFEEFGNVKIYQTTSYEQTAERIKDVDVVITNKVILNEELLKGATSLKMVAITATGVNNVDLNVAKELNIAVFNVAGYSTNSVVELTFALYFYLSRNMAFYDNFGKNEWAKSPIFTNLDRPYNELNGKKWGIIGLGNIGKKVAKIATAFGCEVIYYSTSGKNSSNEYAQTTLDELLINSDIVSIHSPLNENTKNLLNYEKLSLLKKNAILLNLGRGGIVNENDLEKILKEKDFFVGLDVLEKEPPQESNLLLKSCSNVCITPHIAWASIEARNILVDGVVNNIRSYIDGKNQNRVV